MGKSVRILLCSLIFTLSVTGCILTAHSQDVPAARVAWWSLLYERPNPERLPVRIHFRWAKGLESVVESGYNMTVE